MTKDYPVMRRCIACRALFDRKNLLRITRDNNLGVLVNKGMGRSAYICKSDSCSKDSKIKKKLQKALRLYIDSNLYDFIEMEIQNCK